MIRTRPKPRKFNPMHPHDRRTRNQDPIGRRFMLFTKQFCCVICNINAWRFHLHADSWRWLIDGPYHMGGASEFAHIGGGIAGKAANVYGLPLCAKHHRGEGLTLKENDSQEHLKRKFGPHHGIDEDAIMTRLFELFTEQERAA